LCFRGFIELNSRVSGTRGPLFAFPETPATADSPSSGLHVTTFSVGYFVGSLAKASINRKLAVALTHLAPATLELREIPIGDLPLYSYDYDKNYPPAGKALKDAIASVDAVLFVTPEYNRSIPGALKNAIDWASRPWGSNSFSRKPSAIIGTSPGKIGTAVGQQHLRSIMAFCNSPLMNAIEAYIEFTPGLITDEGEVTVDSTREFLTNYMSEFYAYITRVYTAIPRTTGEFRAEASA
jgi:chromate reductase